MTYIETAHPLLRNELRGVMGDWGTTSVLDACADLLHQQLKMERGKPAEETCAGTIEALQSARDLVHEAAQEMLP